MTEQNPLARRESGEIQVSQVNPVAAMLQAITEKGITSESASALEKMTALYLQVEAKNAATAFAQAKSQMQSELPPVIARRAVPNNDGTIRYSFAAFEDIMATVQPYLSRFGFSVSFSQRVDENRLTAICKLTHASGHSETNEFAVRAGKGPPGSSEAQADGSASSYARRFALCNCLNIVIDKDDDARAIGETITPDKAAELNRRVIAIGGDVAAFLKFADAPDFASIKTGKLAMIESALSKKERAKSQQTMPTYNQAVEHGDEGQTEPPASDDQRRVPDFNPKWTREDAIDAYATACGKTLDEVSDIFKAKNWGAMSEAKRKTMYRQFCDGTFICGTDLRRTNV